MEIARIPVRKKAEHRPNGLDELSQQWEHTLNDVVFKWMLTLLTGAGSHGYRGDSNAEKAEHRLNGLDAPSQQWEHTLTTNTSCLERLLTCRSLSLERQGLF